MPDFILDIETNGFLEKTTTTHSLVLRDIATGEPQSFADQPGHTHITHSLETCEMADMLIGHNIIKFDIPVLKKLYPGFSPQGTIMDTLVLARLVYPSIKDIDFEMQRKANLGLSHHYTLPGKLIGSHSLKAWGLRLGCYKGDYDGGWENWSEEMQTYCIQDTEVTLKLYNKLMSKGPSPRSIKLEHDVAQLMFEQEQNGFPFDVPKAVELMTELVQRRGELEEALQEAFPPYIQKTPFTPKVNNKARGYVKGFEIMKEKEIVFNPSSRQQVVDRLQHLYDWKPELETKSGAPKVDDDVLNSLPYPEAKLLAEYFMLQKRLGQISEGRQAWLKQERNGRIHGAVLTNGTISGRAAHAYPNIGQVPSVGAPYGAQCRELFHAPEGWALVGADMSGLELRCLAAELQKFDGGAYAREVLDGDIHTVNQKAAGLETRNQAKTFIYAFLYGAGAEKIGSIVGGSAAHGKALIGKFLKGTPAIAKLRKAVAKQCDKGYLRGLDGRKLPVRAPHAAVNLLLQSGGAVLCKEWLTIIKADLDALGLKHGWDGDYAFCAWVHDEVQIACKVALAQQIGQLCVDACAKAGINYDYGCPLTGEYKIGTNWKETH